MRMHVIARPLAVGLAALITYGPATAETTAGAQPNQRQLEDSIRQYILDHPEVVLESVRRFQEREDAAQKQRSRDGVNANLSELHRGPSSALTAGPAQHAEPVTIVEFFDYRCGYCKKVSGTVSKLANAAGVRVVYKELPILGADSVIAAQAALAAEKQGKYREFHSALMSTAGPVTAAAIDEVAAKLNLDAARLKKDMGSPELEATLRRNHELAESIGVQSTPTFIIGTEVLPGALTEEALNAAIEAARRSSKAARVQAQARRK
jgi:protein-disulfide isomerase